MLASFRAELLKQRKRPAVWVLLLVFAAAVALFGYLFNYLFVVNASGEFAPPPEVLDEYRRYVLPEGILVNALSSGFTGFGGALALILGALAVGGEYGWETFKTSLTQRPGRLGVFVGKLLALAVVLLVFTLVVLAVAALSGYAVATLEDAPVSWPSLGEVLRGVGAGWLILGVFCALGVFLTTLIRGTAFAIGLGLIYLLVLENLFLGLASQNETVEDVGKGLPAKNSLDLAGAFGDVPQGLALPGEALEPSHAALVLAAYAVVLLSLSLLLFRRRDVT
jgi:ABC-type transport system involved in multi-copper enzyme maturation permease subunit